MSALKEVNFTTSPQLFVMSVAMLRRLAAPAAGLAAGVTGLAASQNTASCQTVNGALSSIADRLTKIEKTLGISERVYIVQVHASQFCPLLSHLCQRVLAQFCRYTPNDTVKPAS
jgi:hypothetical protein